LPEPAPQHIGDLQQVLDVLTRVLDLLGSQGALVPVGEALGLLQRFPEHLADHQPVARLMRRGRQRRRDLCVEHVRGPHAPRPFQQRQVLAAGVDDDLDLGVREQRQQRAGVVVAERIDRADQGRPVRAVDRHLHEAEERVVPPL
jgi:hypothetical protein